MAKFEGAVDKALERICAARAIRDPGDFNLLLNLMALLAVRNPGMRDSSRWTEEQSTKTFVSRALADWHHTHGFPEPTKSQIVRKVMKGTRALHPAQQKQARPIQLEQVGQIAHWLDEAIAAAALSGRQAEQLRYTCDRALLLLGFGRGFRGDELARLRVENVNAISRQGMTCFLSQSKGDRECRGKTFKAPALRTLCPVEAYLA